MMMALIVIRIQEREPFCKGDAILGGVLKWLEWMIGKENTIWVPNGAAKNPLKPEICDEIAEYRC